MAGLLSVSALQCSCLTTFQTKQNNTNGLNGSNLGTTFVKNHRGIRFWRESVSVRAMYSHLCPMGVFICECLAGPSPSCLFLTSASLAARNAQIKKHSRPMRRCATLRHPAHPARTERAHDSSQN